LLILVVSFWEGGQEEGCVGVRKAPWWVLVRRRVDECGNLAEGPVWRGHGGGGGGDARGKGLTAAENSGPVFWGLVVGASGVVLRSRALVEMKLGLWSTVRECVTESEGAWRCVGAGTVGETRPWGVLGCCKGSVEEVTVLLLVIWLKSRPLEIGSAIKGWLKWACDVKGGSVYPETSFLLPCRKRQ
jgi:hypothetical protein